MSDDKAMDLAFMFSKHPLTNENMFESYYYKGRHVKGFQVQ